MKHIKLKNSFLLGVMGTLSLVSCQKGNVNSDLSGSSTDAIAVAAITGDLLITAKTSAATPDDSIYVMHTCTRGSYRDSIAAGELPAAVLSYLEANYAGYTVQQAYAVTNKSSQVTGYVVVILFNEKPVAVEFDASGTFRKVLEQREGKDRDGKGWHHGGRFDGRDGRHRDTVALSALPSAITAYYASNYSTDTLVAAFRNKDSSYLVISKNNGAFASVFSSDGAFVSRVQLQSKRAKVVAIDEAALPAKAVNYLSATYPGYVLERALAIRPNNAVLGYVVVIDANATKYAIQFDASGNFVRSVTIS